jgi:hypothetical protein
MVEELSKRGAGACSASLFAIDCIKSLVHECAKASVEDCPLGDWLGERQVVEEIDCRAGDIDYETNQGYQVGRERL